MEIKGNEIVASDGKFVHRKNQNVWFRRATLLTGETIDSFEEADSIPEIVSDFEYEYKVNDLIRQRYSLSEELSLLRQRDNKPEEFQAYYQYAEECKIKAKS